MRSWLSSVAILCLASGSSARADDLVHVQLLAINDFHGQLSAGKELQARPVGSAPVLAAYLRAAQQSFAGDTLIVHAGDQVGASPPESGLLQDEPSIQFLNLLANAHCSYARRDDPRCNLVGTPGNHEFDEGSRELLRLVRGGSAGGRRFLEHPYRGARFPYVSANVVDLHGKSLLAPHVIKLLGGVRIGVIGAVLDETPQMVVQSGVRDVRFLPEAAAINREVAVLRAQGVEAIVVTIHQGVGQAPYEGPTRPDAALPAGTMRSLVAGLDDAVDVVISGHAHAFSNALVATPSGHTILVTQALSSGMAFAEIRLTLDPATHDVREKSARIVATYADAGPGLSPAPDVRTLVDAAAKRVAPLTQRVVGSAPRALTRETSAGGESTLGNLIADAQRSLCGTDVAFMNAGGIRSDLPAGEVRWGNLFAIHPFGNTLVSMTLAGSALRALLEAQWRAERPQLLAQSGLRYSWSSTAKPGERVRDVHVGGRALDPQRAYRVCVNSFLAEGGSGFEAFRTGSERHAGPTDLEALIRYAQKRGGKLDAALDGRVERKDD